MTLAFSFLEDIGTTEIVVGFAALAYVTHLILDALGISRTSRNLRVENEDIVRRNKELEGTVDRLGAEVTRLKEEIAVLVPQVADLQQRDQAAVLRAISEHVYEAALRHEAVLTEIRDALRTHANPS